MFKSFIILRLFVVLPVFRFLHGHESEWFYSKDGIERWSGSCKGLRQSPIDIKDFDTESDVYEAFELKNYDKSIMTIMENNGHTVKLKVNPKDNLYIVGGGLTAKYKLKEIHFHWQSEHTMDGKRYPLEVHFVHVFDTPKMKKIHQNDIHVLSGLYHLIKNNNTDLKQFFHDVPLVESVGATNITNINPRHFLPKTMNEFYRYEGSLTVPDCSENVQWTIFTSKVSISHEQYEIMRSVETLNGSFSINYRNTQPLNERTLKLVYSGSRSSTSALYFSICCFLIVFLSNFE